MVFPLGGQPFRGLLLRLRFRFPDLFLGILQQLLHRRHGILLLEQGFPQRVSGGFWDQAIVEKFLRRLVRHARATKYRAGHPVTPIVVPRPVELEHVRMLADGRRLAFESPTQRAFWVS